MLWAIKSPKQPGAVSCSLIAKARHDIPDSLHLLSNNVDFGEHSSDNSYCLMQNSPDSSLLPPWTMD
jgi:hypothetical protein